uniref:Uncharacterized protein n=1 Tax=Ditylenchus dipsaci TaxID=166011 RepID=A0A915ETP0_9BILA
MKPSPTPNLDLASCQFGLDQVPKRYRKTVRRTVMPPVYSNPNDWLECLEDDDIAKMNAGLSKNVPLDCQEGESNATFTQEIDSNSEDYDFIGNFAVKKKTQILTRESEKDSRLAALSTATAETNSNKMEQQIGDNIHGNKMRCEIVQQEITIVPEDDNSWSFVPSTPSCISARDEDGKENLPDIELLNWKQIELEQANASLTKEVALLKELVARNEFELAKQGNLLNQFTRWMHSQQNNSGQAKPVVLNHLIPALGNPPAPAPFNPRRVRTRR